MNYRAHKIGGTCSGIITSALLFAENPNALSILSSFLIISGASLGSIMPDIDKPTSKIGRNIFINPLSKYIHKKFGHRTITHSAILSLIFLSMLIGSSYMFKDIPFYFYSRFTIGFSVGYLSHLLLDSLTVEGIPLFYPFIKQKFRFMKFRTKKHENLVSNLCLIVTGFLLYIIIR